MSKLPEDADWGLIPDYMRDGIKLYVNAHIRPGGFLQSLLENGPVVDVLTNADTTNQILLYYYLAFFRRYLPDECWGSRENVENWLNERED